MLGGQAVWLKMANRPVAIAVLPEQGKDSFVFGNARSMGGGYIRNGQIQIACIRTAQWLLCLMPVWRLRSYGLDRLTGGGRMRTEMQA